MKRHYKNEIAEIYYVFRVFNEYVLKGTKEMTVLCDDSKLFK